VPFLIFLKSFEVFLYELMSWLVFYPRTLWRSVRRPLEMMKRGEMDLKLPAAEQFRDVVSPPIFLLLTVLAANGFEMVVVGSNPLIDKGIGLASLITDNTTLILFELVEFAALPVIAGAFALAAMRRPLDRDTLQPLFYAQCFTTAPVVLFCSLGATLTRLPDPAANVPASLLFGVAAIFYVGVEAAWFSRESKRGLSAGMLWAVAAFVISVVILGTILLLFSVD
jgi:hypothetical protein